MTSTFGCSGELYESKQILAINWEKFGKSLIAIGWIFYYVRPIRNLTPRSSRWIEFHWRAPSLITCFLFEQHSSSEPNLCSMTNKRGDLSGRRDFDLFAEEYLTKTDFLEVDIIWLFGRLEHTKTAAVVSKYCSSVRFPPKNSVPCDDFQSHKSTNSIVFHFQDCIYPMCRL